MLIPDWFHIGLKFKSKWINYEDNECIIQEFSAVTNTCEVKIILPSTTFTEDNWNLEHTIWGFEQGDYIIITDEEESFGHWYNSKQEE